MALVRSSGSGASTVREEDYELQGGIRLNLERHSDRVRLLVVTSTMVAPSGQLKEMSWLSTRSIRRTSFSAMGRTRCRTLDSPQNTTVAWPPDWYEVDIPPVNFHHGCAQGPVDGDELAVHTLDSADLLLREGQDALQNL